MTPVTSEAPPWTAMLPSATMPYIAVPSREHPLLVASLDPRVLRYLAGSVLSVPPGAGGLRSFALTVGLRLLQYRTTWILAGLVRAAAVVHVRRVR